MKSRQREELLPIHDFHVVGLPVYSFVTCINGTLPQPHPFCSAPVSCPGPCEHPSQKAKMRRPRTSLPRKFAFLAAMPFCRFAPHHARARCARTAGFARNGVSCILHGNKLRQVALDTLQMLAEVSLSTDADVYMCKDSPACALALPRFDGDTRQGSVHVRITYMLLARTSRPTPQHGYGPTDATAWHCHNLQRARFLHAFVLTSA